MTVSFSVVHMGPGLTTKVIQSHQKLSFRNVGISNVTELYYNICIRTCNIVGGDMRDAIVILTSLFAIVLAIYRGHMHSRPIISFDNIISR